MRERDLFAAVAGFYLLTPRGELAFYDRFNHLVVDTELSPLFESHNLELLDLYLRNPQAEADGGPLRVGVVCQPKGVTSLWRSGTLMLETPVLRTLYRVKETQPAELTEFQKRSRAQSVFRGMELLLDYRLETFPDTPVYCPVLHYRGTTLDQYAYSLGLEPDLAQSRWPVIEVLNLLATVPVLKRSQAPIWHLQRRIMENVIRRDLRRPTELSLVDVPTREPFNGLGRSGPRRAEAPFPKLPLSTSVDRSAPVDIETPPASMRVSASAERAGIAKLACGVELDVLRAYSAFAGLPPARLARIAAAARLYSAPPGVRILRRGSSDKGTLFLLRGDLRLEAADGACRLVCGYSPEAEQPIAPGKPRQYSVHSETAVCFLWIPDAMLADTMLTTSAADDSHTQSSARLASRNLT